MPKVTWWQWKLKFINYNDEFYCYFSILTLIIGLLDPMLDCILQISTSLYVALRRVNALNRPGMMIIETQIAWKENVCVINYDQNFNSYSHTNCRINIFLPEYLGTFHSNSLITPFLITLVLIMWFENFKVWLKADDI